MRLNRDGDDKSFFKGKGDVGRKTMHLTSVKVLTHLGYLERGDVDTEAFKSLNLRLLMSYIYIYIWSTNS